MAIGLLWLLHPGQVSFPDEWGTGLLDLKVASRSRASRLLSFTFSLLASGALAVGELSEPP